MPASGSVTFFRLAGIPLRVHWSLGLALVWITWAAGNAMPYYARAAGVPVDALVLPYRALGALLAIALFASVLLHELSHALVALHFRYRVRSITLMMLGGVSAIEIPSDGHGEAGMAAAGPLASLAIALVTGLAGWIVPTRLADLRLLLDGLSIQNLGLAIFNLLPAFPMDGGRVLRALLAPRLGTLRATGVAAVVGRVFALAFAAMGFLSGNVILILIALFVWAGAGAERRHAMLRGALTGVRARELLFPSEESADFGEPVADAAYRMRLARRLTFPVRFGRRVVGMLTAGGVSRVPPERRASTPVREVTIPTEPVKPDDPIELALQRMTERDLDSVPVAGDDDELLGVIRRSDVERWLALRALDDHPPV